jgi:hypothetical protein
VYDDWIDSIGVRSMAHHHFLNLLFPGGNIPFDDSFLCKLLYLETGPDAIHCPYNILAIIVEDGMV